MWESDIAGCGFEDEAVEELLVHQHFRGGAPNLKERTE